MVASPSLAAGFGGFVGRARSAGRIVVQPRMGFADPVAMRSGIAATAAAGPATAGTITLDSYTRTEQYSSVVEALRRGAHLNGYPIVTHDASTTRRVVEGLQHADFQIQVRHGSASPARIIAAMTAAGIHATEGGPVSYCLPYGRTPLRTSVENWRRSCELLAATRDTGVEPHLETFGGCLLGQLCPPSVLVAVSVLEAMFFRQHGLRSISLSYTQQVDHGQDAEALRALRLLAAEYLTDVDWHVVLYTYMGVFPSTRAGARRLSRRAARLAASGQVDRLIVKTTAEAHRIPTIAENVEALVAAAHDVEHAEHAEPATDAGEVLAESRALIEATLEHAADVGSALAAAFGRGHLDVPYCLHPDNAGAARSYIAADGRIAWLRVGAMPLRPPPAHRPELTSTELLGMLAFVADSCDAPQVGGRAG